MMLLPIQAELGFSRFPGITVLICLICGGVFFAQSSNWHKIEQRSDSFCERQQDRVLDMVFKNTFGVPGKPACLQFVRTASQHQDPDQLIKSAAANSKAFATLTLGQSRALTEKRLLSTFQQYQSAVPENLTSKLAYAPQTYSVLKMFTSTLAHSSWSHILGNLFIFFAFAASVEVALGYGRYLAAYSALTVVTALSYSVVMSVIASPLPTIGLSGIVMGMIGLFIFLVPYAKIRCFLWVVIIFKFISVPAWVLAIWYVGWDIYSLFYQQNESNINFVAHVSGACFGYLFGVVFCRDIKNRINVEMNRATRAQKRKLRDSPKPLSF